MTEEKLTNLGLLLFRVTLGIVFVAHGYLKVFTFGIPHAIEVFEAHTVWHINMIPGWFAPPAAVIEWLGGIMLILGVKHAGLCHFWPLLPLAPVPCISKMGGITPANQTVVGNTESSCLFVALLFIFLDRENIHCRPF